VERAALSLATPLLVSSWCAASRTIRNCCWPWFISSPPRSASPVTLPRENAVMEMNEFKVKLLKHFKKVNLETYVFSVALTFSLS